MGGATGLAARGQVTRAQTPVRTGRGVVVGGGGNVAMDTARTGRRLGALEIKVADRRGRDPIAHVVVHVQILRSRRSIQSTLGCFAK